MVTLEYTDVTKVTVVSSRRALRLTYHARLPRPVGVDHSVRGTASGDTLVETAGIFWMQGYDVHRFAVPALTRITVYGSDAGGRKGVGAAARVAALGSQVSEVDLEAAVRYLGRVRGHVLGVGGRIEGRLG